MQLLFAPLDNHRPTAAKARSQGRMDRTGPGKAAMAKTASIAAKTWSPVAPATAVVAMLKPGGRVIGLTMGQFSMIDIVGALLDVTGPADVKLSTWTAGIRDASNAAFMLDNGRMTSFELYCDKSFPSREPAYCAAVAQMFGEKAVNAADIHAKVCTIRNRAWNITIRGSMNLNKNPRCENFDIDDDAGIADFFDAHFENMRQCGVPLGLGNVRPKDVHAVFDRIRRGVNPFSIQPREQLMLAGVPLGGDFQTWVRARLRGRPGMKNIAAAAKALGVSWAALSDAVQSGDGDLCEELASLLV